MILNRRQTLSTSTNSNFNRLSIENKQTIVYHRDDQRGKLECKKIYFLHVFILCLKLLNSLLCHSIVNKVYNNFSRKKFTVKTISRKFQQGNLLVLTFQRPKFF